MSTYTWPPSSGSSGIPIYANVAAFPSSGNIVGQQAVDASNVGNIYEWNGSSWVLTASSSSVILGNLTDVGTDGIVVTNGTNCVIGTGTSLAQHVADTTHNGYLSSTDWNTFNNKQPTLTTGNLTSSPTTNLVVTGGTGAVIGSGALLTLTGASLIEATSSVLTITGATNAVLGTGVTIQVKQSSTSQSGYLSNTDWNTFNGKQASGNYITALTGEGTASGPGSVALTLTNSAVIGKVLTGYVSGAGTVASTDSILQAIQKLNGNIGALSGTVTSVSVVTANGVSGSVATATTTPAITLTLGAITPSSVNVSGLTASSAVATDASKNLVSVTNTGTGSNVLATSPTLVTPALGTPSALVLTNATGATGSNFGTQTAGAFFVGPTSGSAANPTFRAMVSQDIPVAAITNDALLNLGLSQSIASSALTIAIKQNDGSTDATADAAAVIAMRSSTATTGSYLRRAITGALSQVISSTTTLGMRASQSNNLWIYAIDSNGSGTMKVGAATTKWSDRSLQSTVAESFSATATNASPAVFTANGHGMSNGMAITLTGTPPTGFSTATKYYVVSKATNTFQLATAPGGTGINSSSTGSAIVVHMADGTLVSDAVYASVPVRLIGRMVFNLATSGTWIAPTEVDVFGTDRDPEIYGAAASSIPGQPTGGNPIVWSNLISDTHGCYNTGNGRYVVQSPGYYMVATVLVYSGGANYLSVYKNGVEYSRIVSASASATGTSGSVGVKCALYDVIDIRPDVTTSGAPGGDTYTNFSIQKCNGTF